MSEPRRLVTPERRDELAALEANTKQISAHLRALHKAAGGFELP